MVWEKEFVLSRHIKICGNPRKDIVASIHFLYKCKHVRNTEGRWVMYI